MAHVHDVVCIVDQNDTGLIIVFVSPIHIQRVTTKLVDSVFEVRHFSIVTACPHNGSVFVSFVLGIPVIQANYIQNHESCIIISRMYLKILRCSSFPCFRLIINNVFYQLPVIKAVEGLTDYTSRYMLGSLIVTSSIIKVCSKI